MPDEVMLEPSFENMDATGRVPDIVTGIVPRDPGDLPAAGDAATTVENALLSSLEPTQELPVEESSSDWRDELSAKMQDYRTRRKPRGPKYPSLQLPFELPLEKFESFRPASPDAVSWSSLALEPELVEPAKLDGPQCVPEPVESSIPLVTTNLIEFPRYAEAPAWDELAESLLDQPRILDAPELVPLGPALGGILLDAPEKSNPNTVAEAPLRPASIGRRFLAAVIDVAFVGGGVVLWGWIFLKVTHEIPPRPQMVLSSAVIVAVLWLGYQFLLMVWSGTTLGLRACRLELVSLDGKIPKRKQKRWRLLASLLSAGSLMLGYAWVLLDENRLCWHDRISRTYLRVREP